MRATMASTMATDTTYSDDVFVRLLVQRGGGWVETTDRVGQGALYAPVPVLLAHLEDGPASLTPAGGLVA